MIATLILLTLVAASTSITDAWAAEPDNNVEWIGISHVAWQDRRPLCPVAGESFAMRFQAYENDLTAARVQVDDGATTWIDAQPIAVRGPYEIWEAQIPATTASQLGYIIELTDGSDTDYGRVGP